MMRLAKKFRKSLFSLFMAVFISRAISFTAQIILARILVPEDFGLMAIALMLTFSFRLLQTMGVSEALVVQRDRTQEAGDTALFLLLLFGLGMGCLIFASAPVLSQFFHAKQETLTLLIRALTAILILNSFHAVPDILFEKDLEFERKILIEILPALGYAVVSIILAYQDRGVWSLVFGRIFSVLITVPLVWKLSAFRPTFRFDPALAKKLLSFGKYIALGSLASFVVANMDDVIVGRLLTFTVLGHYTMAYTIANVVVVNVAQLVNRVSFPVYARIAGNPHELKKFFLLTIRYISMIAAPFAMVLVTQGRELTLALIGEKWMPMVPALRLLALSAFLRALYSNTGPLFNGSGRPQYILSINIRQIFLLFIFLTPMTLLYNLYGTALGALCVSGLVGLMLFSMLRRIMDLRPVEVIRGVAPSMGVAVVVGLLVTTWTRSLAPGMGIETLTPLAAFSTPALAAALFFLLMYLLNRETFLEMFAFIRGDFSMEGNGSKRD